MSKELKVSLKGLSSLPTLKVARENIQKNKVNAPTALMRPAIDAVDAFLSSDTYKSAADSDALFETWLDGHSKASTEKSRGLLRDIAETTFTIIVGQVWPREFGSLDETQLTIDIDGTSVECKMETVEKEVKI